MKMRLKKEGVHKLKRIREQFKNKFGQSGYDHVMEYTREQLEVANDALVEGDTDKNDLGKIALYLAYGEDEDEEGKGILANENASALLKAGLVSFALDDGILDRIEIV